MDERVEYPGNWMVNGREYFGTLVIAQQKGIIRLVLHNRVGIQFLFSEGDMPDVMPFIRGELIPYGRMCLINSRIIRVHTDISRNTKTVVLDCEYCINADFKSYEEIVFSKMEVRFSNTFAWSGLNGVKIEYKEVTKRKHDLMLGKNNIFILQHKFKKEIKYSIDKNTTISLVPYFHDKTGVPMTSEDITISQFVKIKIASKENHNLFYYIDILDKIKALIEMGIQQNIDIREIKVYNRKKKNKINDKIIYTPISFYSKSSFKDDYKEPDIQDMLFSLADKPSKDLFQIWFDKYDSLKPILELYREIIDYDRLPISRAFLNVVQALEYYHMRFVCSGKDQYEKIVKNEYLHEEIFHDLWDNKQIKEDYILIKNRILHLFCRSKLVIFDSYIKTIRFVNSIINTRHYLTHYSQEKELKSLTDINLEEAYIIVRQLLKFYILKELGFDEVFINSKIQSEITEIMNRYKRAYKGSYSDLYELINLNVSIDRLVEIVCRENNLGKYKNMEIIDKSEDIKLLVKTEKQNYKIRFFNKHKSYEECMDFIKNNKVSNENKGKGIKFYKLHGKNIYELEYGYNAYKICVSDEGN